MAGDTVTGYEAKNETLEGKGGQRLENRAAGRDFHGGNSPREQNHQPIAMSAVQYAGIVCQRGEDMVYYRVLAVCVAVLVRDIRAATAD